MKAIRRLALMAATISMLALAMAGSAGAATVTAFPLESIGIGGLAQTSDGTILYSGSHPNGTVFEGKQPSGYLGRVGPDGPLGETAVPSPYPGPIAAGSEGDTWFALGAEPVARLTSTGAWSVSPTGPGTVVSVVAAAGGGVWFTKAVGGGGIVGKISPSGAVSEWPIGTDAENIGEIVEGHEGDAWFAEPQSGKVGRITPAGQVTQFAVPNEAQPYDLAVDGEGSIWFDGRRNQVGRISPDGAAATFGLPAGVIAESLAAGPDGRIWFIAERRKNYFEGFELGRIGPTGRYSAVPLPAAAAFPIDLLAGSEGNLWFAAYGDPPCLGGGGSCIVYERKSPAIVGRVTVAPLKTAVAESKGFVYRNRVNVPISCSEGNVAQTCRGTIEVKAHGRVLGRDRYVVPVDYTRQWPAKRLERVPSLLKLTAMHRRGLVILRPDVGAPVRRAVALGPAG